VPVRSLRSSSQGHVNLISENSTTRILSVFRLLLASSKLETAQLFSERLATLDGEFQNRNSQASRASLSGVTCSYHATPGQAYGRGSGKARPEEPHLGAIRL